MSAEDDVTTRFYMQRRPPDAGAVTIYDGKDAVHPIVVHAADVDFVCAAMNAADKDQKKCTV